MLYVRAAGCGWSNQPGIPEAVEVLKLRLAEFAEREQMSFMAIGVALDWSPEEGMEHVAKFGPFDELSVGYNWGNSLALRYMWSSELVAPVTPQVVVYRRLLTVPKDSVGPARFGEADVTLVGSLGGAKDIIGWANSDLMLPPAGGIPVAIGPSS
jgi:hypothetical protein